jgi:hypothetical protein
VGLILRRPQATAEVKVDSVGGRVEASSGEGNAEDNDNVTNTPTMMTTTSPGGGMRAPGTRLRQIVHVRLPTAAQGERSLPPQRLLGIAVRILRPGLRRPVVDGLRLSEGSQQLSIEEFWIREGEQK